MDLQEITSLISIRDEVSRLFNEQSGDLKVPREKIVFLQELQKKLNKKIGMFLLNSDFQNYVDGKPHTTEKQIQPHSNDFGTNPKQQTWPEFYREMGANVQTVLDTRAGHPPRVMVMMPGRSNSFEVPDVAVPSNFVGTNQSK